jgi:serine/threonine-protein kinase RsbW
MEQMTATWDLPRDLTAGAAARRHVADFLSAADSDDLRDACELVASELAVNAVRHGLPPATMTLRRDGNGVLVEVTNRVGATLPNVGSLDTESDHGRGLAIAARLAEHLDWDEADGRIRVRAQVSG